MTDEIDKQYQAFWRGLTLKGDPARIPNKMKTGFEAGWQAALSFQRDTGAQPETDHHKWKTIRNHSEVALSSRGDAGTLRKWEPEFGAVLASLIISAQNLLDWVPTCSVGSSGYLRIEALKAALKKFGELPSYSCPHCGNTGAVKCEHWEYRAEAESALAHREPGQCQICLSRDPKVRRMIPARNDTLQECRNPWHNPVADREAKQEPGGKK